MPESRCLVPANSFAEYAPDRIRRPALGGLWTEFKGDRGTKSKPIPGPHLVDGFQTTAPNTVVRPIHPRAMPVMLTTPEECDAGCARRGTRRRRCSDRCATRRSK
jgi:putative SOS response-associated peptidase YedK